MNYYFAYGSNLNLADWTKWCVKNNYQPSVLVEFSRAFLPGYVTNYSHYSTGRKGGAANLRMLDNNLSGTYGCLFYVGEDCMNILDEKEGYPNHYDRKTVTVITEAGVLVEAVTYISAKHDENEFHQPTDEYHDLIVDGLSSRGMLTDRICGAKDDQEIFDCGHIIVYGTLKRNNARQDIMPGEFLAEGIITGELYDLGSYPGLTNGDREIHCEIYLSKDLANHLTYLDHIEGADLSPPYYTRRIIPVKYGEDKIIWGHCYYFNQDTNDYSVIQSGIW
jgi:gamma-glutamylcyclotransferase (GGCT)/AIG2-like uncharacterized protein YtfP